MRIEKIIKGAIHKLHHTYFNQKLSTHPSVTFDVFGTLLYLSICIDSKSMSRKVQTLS